MAYLVKITDFDPADYCFQCMFCRVDNYKENLCMLHSMDRIYFAEYDKPEWCPFNCAEEVED